MSMKKMTILALIIVLSLVTVVGCSSNNNSNNNSKTGGEVSQPSESTKPVEKAKDPVKLTFWGGVPAESGPQEVVDTWNKENPDIQVEYVRYVNDDSGNLKLDTALLSGQNVDLYVNYSLVGLENRVKAGVALELGQYQADYNIDEKMGPDAQKLQVDGKYYGLPTTKPAFFVVLNKDLLDAAGLSVPQSWTWNELREYAKVLKADGRYGYLSHMEPFPDPMDSVLEKNGYIKSDGTSNLDDPLNVTWLNTLKSMMEEDKTTPPFGEQLTTKLPAEATFLKGESAILNIGSWMFRSSNNLTDFPRDFKIAFAPVPRMVEQESDYITRGGLGDNISINAKSKYTKEAWEFLKWYADGGMAPMATGGRLPASKDTDIEAALAALLGENIATYDVESLEYVLFGRETPSYGRNLPNQVMDIRQEEYEKFFLGAQSAEQAMTNAAKRHNDFLKQNK